VEFERRMWARRGPKRGRGMTRLPHPGWATLRGTGVRRNGGSVLPDGKVSMHALSSRGRKAARVLVRTQNQLKEAFKPVLEALEPRQLLSAGDQIGSTAINDLGTNERGGFVVRLADQSLIQVGSTGTC